MHMPTRGLVSLGACLLIAGGAYAQQSPAGSASVAVNRLFRLTGIVNTPRGSQSTV